MALGGYSRIHHKSDCHSLDRAWHCGASFRGSVFLPPGPGKGPATEESQNLQQWHLTVQRMVSGRALPSLCEVELCSACSPIFSIALK